MINNKVLSKKTVLSFGLQELAASMLAFFIATQQNYFLTEILLISPAAVGIVLSVSRIVELISAPFVGIVLEKNDFKWGKYRSWLIIALIPMSVFYFLMFGISLFNISSNIIIYFIGTFLLLGALSSNLLNAVDTTMICSVTYKAKDRMRLSRSKSLGRQSGRIIQSSIGITLLYTIIRRFSTPAIGFSVAIIVIMIFNYFAYINMFKQTKKYKSHSTEAHNKIPVIKMFKLLMTNLPLLNAFIVYILKVGGFYLIYISAAYYYKYVIGNMYYMSIMFTIINILGLAGAWIAPYIIEKIGTKKTTMILLSVMSILYIFIKIFGKNQILFILIVSVIAICSSAINVIINILFSDAIDYGEYKNGINLRGLSMVFIPTAMDAGRTIGQIALSSGLAIIGYSANMVVNPQTANKLLSIISYFPALITFLALILMCFYKLDANTMFMIRSELTKMKARKISNS